MAVQWTVEQKRVIDSRNQNLLVSAAAGSGKTAVLVQHIMDLILDPVEPASVDELLVVTFTRAAAAEMKDRLRVKMEDHLREHPEQSNLRRQMSLIDQAHICTTDSFCSWLVKNYFYQLDIDPDFRILDETEAKLLKEDVMDDLLEEAYAKSEEKFLHLADGFTSDRNDRQLRDLILRVNRFAEAMPWPEQWIRELTESKEEIKEFGAFPWAEAVEVQLRRDLEEWLKLALWGEKVCTENAWLQKYQEMFASDRSQIERILSSESLEQMMTGLTGITFMTKPRIAAKQVEDPGLREDLSSLRDMIKKGVGKIQEKYVIEDLPMVIESINRAANDRVALAKISLDYRERYRKAKLEKNTAEFGDVAHWALQLLLKNEEGQETPTELADELSHKFREIIVDEYQDSNLIQEKLLLALSSERFGFPNMFMVGDVKQSIYKFRMARPKLFMDKYRRFSYEQHKGFGCKIDLGKNFRSRASVLREANVLFEQIMTLEHSQIAYDEHAKLYHGNMDYPGTDPETELLLVNNEERGAEAPELEARAIAIRILEMMNVDDPMMVWDKDLQSMRPVRYSDIVILLRTVEGWAEEIQQSLVQQGIPAFTEQKRGYFQAYEVQVLLNFLQLIDNPLQDIPLAIVLRSPVVGMDDQLLAKMSVGEDTECFWERCCHASERGIGTSEWQRFESMLNRYRQEAIYLSISELLELILRETHYDQILAASPDGAVCMANVEMLIERAREFEESMYHGIFQFLRYMEKLRSYDMDFGEAQLLSESEDLVRITSIHKSKGLEYPVVFVSGLAKQFNYQDTHSAFLIDEQLGLVCDDIDTQRRTRMALPDRRFIMDKMTDDIRQEEIRVLYVALTRAKEKLICTAAVSNRKSLDTMISMGTLWRSIVSEIDESREKYLPSILIGSANSYLDWIGMAIMNNPEAHWKVREMRIEELVREEVEKSLADDFLQQRWIEQGFLTDPDPEILQKCKRASEWKYTWGDAIHQKALQSVSELKHEAAERYLASMESTPVQDRHQRMNYETGENLGAKLGTAYHLVFEKLEASRIHSIKDVMDGMDQLVRRGILSEEFASMLDEKRIYQFYGSDLGIRMAEAERKGKLYKEQPFVMQRPRAFDGDSANEEMILVQGIIDAFMVEDDGITLWDYKTDRVPDQNPEQDLIGKYQTQLNLYRHAIEQARGQKVKEVWIYSVTLGRMIPVPTSDLAQYGDPTERNKEE